MTVHDDARGARGETRRWWLAARSASSLDRFRIAAGFLLMLHLGEHWVETPPLLDGGGLYDAELLRAPRLVRASWIAGGLSTGGVSAVFAFGIVLALGIVLGTAPRLCAAALFVLLASTWWAILPIAHAGDYLANVIAFFLVLMPIGKTLCVSLRRGSTAVEEPRVVSGIAASVFVALLSVLYVTGAIGELLGVDRSEARLVALGLQAVPAAFILPGEIFQAVGLLLQVGLHGWLAWTGEAVLANALLAATALLFWGEKRPHGSDAWEFDAGAMTALSCVVVVAMAAAGPSVGAPWMTDGSRQLLADLGLLPWNGVVKIGPSPASLAVKLDREDGEPDHVFAAPGARLRALVARLERSESDPLRQSLASGLARRYCRESKHLGQRGRLALLSGERERSILEFGCGPDGVLSATRR